MAIQTIKLIGPAYWASYFINGDASGLEYDEKAMADAWYEHESNGLRNFSIVDCGEPYFSTRFDLYASQLAEAGITGGDVVEYTAIYHED